jgi:lipid-A-disaccharide synthase
MSKTKNIPTHYYIAPQIWAGKKTELLVLKRFFDKLYVILPFEKIFFETNISLQ